MNTTTTTRHQITSASGAFQPKCDSHPDRFASIVIAEQTGGNVVGGSTRLRYFCAAHVAA
jgi:hypothetical protein